MQSKQLESSGHLEKKFVSQAQRLHVASELQEKKLPIKMEILIATFIATCRKREKKLNISYIGGKEKLILIDN